MNVLREWEFKLVADASALGQLLRYVALARHQNNFQRTVLGVLAAFEFAEDVRFTVECMNLGIEVVQLPPWLRNAGLAFPSAIGTVKPVHIPIHPVNAHKE